MHIRSLKSFLHSVINRQPLKFQIFIENHQKLFCLCQIISSKQAWGSKQFTSVA